MEGIYGSANYVAPEMVQGYYDCKVDVFSAGVIFYALMTLKLPHNGWTNADILERIENEHICYLHTREISCKYDITAFHLLQRMLRKKPETRITAIDASYHTWT